MAGLRILTNNLALTATLTASSEATGHAATNLNSSKRYADWRTTTGTAEGTLQLDMGSTKQLYGFGAVDATVFAGGGIQVEYKLLVGDPWTVLGHMPFPTFNPTSTSVLWRTVAARYVMYRFTNPAAVSAYAQLGVAFLAGSHVQPTRSVAPGASVQRIDQSQTRRAVGGQRSSVQRPKFHTMDFMFHLRTPQERDVLASQFDTIGNTVPAIWALDPDDWRIVYGVQTSPLSVEHRTGTVDLSDLKISVAEDIA